MAESNFAESQRKAALCHFQLYCSQPLQKVRASTGAYRIPSGGTATFGRREFTQLFDDHADHSGQWPVLRSTTRVTATWHQVADSVKLLGFNFYAIANAASERSKFVRNNELLSTIFAVAAKFGDVPTVVAGDFQKEPGMYPAVQLALDHIGDGRTPFFTQMLMVMWCDRTLSFRVLPQVMETASHLSMASS